MGQVAILTASQGARAVASGWRRWRPSQRRDRLIGRAAAVTHPVVQTAGRGRRRRGAGWPRAPGRPNISRQLYGRIGRDKAIVTAVQALILRVVDVAGSAYVTIVGRAAEQVSSGFRVIA